jgi:predicted N-acetyltransferase YhbS
MSLTIRNTTCEDARHLPAIEKAAGQVFASIPGLEWIAEDSVMSVERHTELAEQGTHWVARDSTGKICGFLAAERASGALHIAEISVHPDVHRQGIGRALIAHAIAHAAPDPVTLTTFIDVPWNAPYYARLGFDLLSVDQCDARLRHILADEVAHGIPGDRRCAMIYRPLAPPAPAR